MKYYIQTFGCQQNVADSEWIAAALEARGMKPAKTIQEAGHVVINTCMVRESAENRVYGLVNNLTKFKTQNSKLKTTTQNPKTKDTKIIVTGCMVGMAVREKSGKLLKILKKRMPQVDEFLPIEEVGFDHGPLRTDSKHAWVPISNGCNNFCTFCVVPFSRGREISRPCDEIVDEVEELVASGFDSVTLLGMNVNSYGADLVIGKENVQVMRDIKKRYFENSKYEARDPKQIQNPNEKNSKQRKSFKPKPVYVKHLGRFRIPTLFPQLLEEIANISGLNHIDFMSSNPWDFSDELIAVIAKYPNITRHIHLPVQSGDNKMLKKMNRWYTREEYLDLLEKIRKKIPDATFGTDIIVGFCGETEKQFQNTVELCKKAQFSKAYIAIYSDRPLTAAHKAYKDDVPYKEKKRRWRILEEFINQPNQ